MKKQVNMYVTTLAKLFRLIFVMVALAFGALFSFSAINLPAPDSIARMALCAAVPSLATGGLPSVSVNKSVLLSLAMPQLGAVPVSAKVDIETVEPVDEDVPLPPPDLPEAAEATFTSATQTGYTSTDGIYISNETPYSVDIESLINEPLPFEASGDPLVLIIHTHTSESYTPTQEYNYVPTDTDRTEDIRFNVARVGGVIENALNDAGIGVIHDSSINDYPSYSGSYSKAMALTKSYLEKYPSIKVVLDIHRDYIEREDGTKMKAVFSANDQKAAQVMLVVGTDASGLEHPSWRRNMSFALKLQRSMLDNYANIARPINLRRQRFNEHLAPGALIVEVGTSGNTLEEAMLGAECFSQSLIEVINGV